MCYLLSHSIAPKKAYLDARYRRRLPVTKPIGERGNFLPMHTELDDEQIKFITDSVLEF
jgi:dTDP-4-amino-4,6-dideoxygalactose transaminase